MKKLTIIEIDYHSEVLRNLLIISAKGDYMLQVVTSKNIWSKTGLTSNNYDVLFTDDFSGGIKGLLNSKKAEVNGSDAIIFNTSSTYYKFFSKQNFVPPVLVRIHNVNTSFLPPWKQYKVKWNWYFLWKDFSHFVRRELFLRDFKWRRKFYKQVDGFSFFSSQMEEYAASLNRMDSLKIVKPVLPGAFYSKEESNNASSKVLTFTIIGGIDQRRRDYDLLINALKLFKDKTSRSVVIILLGRPISSYGVRIQNELRALQSDTLKIELYDAFVEQETFDHALGRTDYLLNPLKEATRHTIYAEYYGKSKISGAVNEMIQFGLPAVFPEFYKPIKDLESEYYSFENSAKGLEKTLLRIVNNHQETNVPENYSQLFSLNQMSLQMEQAIEALINTKKVH